MCCKTNDGDLKQQSFKVKKRDKATSMLIIQNEIELRITIYSDQWQAYYSIFKGVGYYHKTVNYSNFLLSGAQMIKCI
jgi:hypothetical protein